MLPDWAGYQRLREKLADANRNEEYPIDWLDHEVLSGRAWPITGERSAIVVSVFLYPGGKRVARVPAAAGDLDEILNVLMSRAIEWAQAKGCEGAEVHGRAGWAREFEKRGWVRSQVVLEKDI